MASDYSIWHENCGFFNGMICTASFYEQSFCLKCSKNEYKKKDYSEYSEDYPHLFNPNYYIKTLSQLDLL